MSMENMFQAINRHLYLDGVEVTVEEFLGKIKQGQAFKVVLKPVHQSQVAKVVEEVIEEPEYMQVGKSYLFKVRQYMTKPATPDFDFQAKFNDNNPMPFRTMVGTVIKETRGMVYMDCHVEPMETSTCMRCGRRLNHPVSMLYGIGPECGSHAYINPFNSEDELHAALDEVRNTLRSITWKGWVIKTAIEEFNQTN